MRSIGKFRLIALPLVALAVSLTAMLLTTTSASASPSTIHVTVDVSESSIVCDDGTIYEAQPGSHIKAILHSNSSASGGSNFTMQIRGLVTLLNTSNGLIYENHSALVQKVKTSSDGADVFVMIDRVVLTTPGEGSTLALTTNIHLIEGPNGTQARATFGDCHVEF